MERALRWRQRLQQQQQQQATMAKEDEAELEDSVSMERSTWQTGRKEQDEKLLLLRLVSLNCYCYSTRSWRWW